VGEGGEGAQRPVLCVKGIVSREEYFLKAYNNKQVLSVHALIVCYNLAS
jgi:hypothetical protein